MPSSRFHYDLPSNKAGREVNRDSSWQVAPAISLERGTGVGVNRHSSRLLRGEMIREAGWWLVVLPAVSLPGRRRWRDHDGLEGVLHLPVTAPVRRAGAGVGGPVQRPGQGSQLSGQSGGS